MKNGFEYKLEILRGIAALIVLFHHTVNHPFQLDPHYHPTDVWWIFIPPGHLSVLVFFVLSGYVIGYTNPEPLTREAIPFYLKKRILRVYPLYFIAIIVTIIITQGTWPVSSIIKHLLFLNKPNTTIFDNSPLWSLPFEVLYYLLFIPISYFKINTKMVLFLSFVLSIVFYFQHKYIIHSYFIGLVFWIMGAQLSGLKEGGVRYRTGEYISLLFLIFSIEYLNPINDITTKLYGGYPKISLFFPDYTYIPFCFIIITVFTNRKHPLLKITRLLIYILPAVSIGIKLVDLSFNISAIFTMEAGYLFFPIIFYLLSLASLGINFKSDVIKRNALYIGSLSYGIYVIHFPIISIFRRIDFFSGTAFTYIVRLIILIPVVIFAAYIMERKIQPFVKKWFQPKKLDVPDKN